MKKLLPCLCLLLCLSLTLPVFASEEPARLVDDADCLTASQEARLLEKLDGLSEYYEMDIVIVTVTSLRGQPITAYADDYYDYNGYRCDGILLLVATWDREWAISTSGYGITAFTDAGQEYMVDRFIDDLTDGNYADAFHTFADLCDDFIAQAKAGRPYDKGNLPKDPFPVVLALVGALAVGLVLAFIITGSMKRKLHSVRYQTAASQYAKPDSLRITGRRELYLYRHITRRRRETQRSGGGSSSHRGSSGRSHGGSHGRF